MPPTLFPVCLGFASSSGSFSTHYFTINTNLLAITKSLIVKYIRVTSLHFEVWNKTYQVAFPDFAC